MSPMKINAYFLSSKESIRFYFTRYCYLHEGTPLRCSLDTPVNCLRTNESLPTSKGCEIDVVEAGNFQ